MSVDNGFGPLPRRAEELMPHSGPMCVIDLLTIVSEDFAEASVVLKPSSPFIRADGSIEECVFIEMIAQAIAARSGLDLTAEKLKTQKGYLLGVKNMKIVGTARVGDTLRVKVCKTGQYGDFSIIEGSVLNGEHVLAQGEIKVVQIIEPGSGAA